jgi:hypothetical protein
MNLPPQQISLDDRSGHKPGITRIRFVWCFSPSISVDRIDGSFFFLELQIGST